MMEAKAREGRKGQGDGEKQEEENTTTIRLLIPWFALEEWPQSAPPRSGKWRQGMKRSRARLVCRSSRTTPHSNTTEARCLACSKLQRKQPCVQMGNKLLPNNETSAHEWVELDIVHSPDSSD